MVVDAATDRVRVAPLTGFSVEGLDLVGGEKILPGDEGPAFVGQDLVGPVVEVALVDPLVETIVSEATFMAAAII